MQCRPEQEACCDNDESVRGAVLPAIVWPSVTSASTSGIEAAQERGPEAPSEHDVDVASDALVTACCHKVPPVGCIAAVHAAQR